VKTFRTCGIKIQAGPAAGAALILSDDS